MRLKLKTAMLPLCLLILIDHMGFGIVYPILLPVFMDSTQSILGLGVSESAKSLWYSITLSVFPISVFFSAASVGDFSDQFGRKRVLSVCLFIGVIGYLLSALAVDYQNLPLLIASRFLAGLSAGSMPIAQAATIDLSEDEEKAANLGLVILMGSVGFLLGPFVGALFTNKSIVSWFSYSSPLYAAAFIALFNLWMLRFFKETFVPKKHARISVKRIVGLIVVPFSMPNIRFLATIFLLMQLAWSFYFQFSSIFLLKKHSFLPQEIGYFMSLVGIGCFIGSFWLLRWITKVFDDSFSGLLTLLSASVSVGLLVYKAHPVSVWLSAFFVGLSISVAYAVLVKLFSSLVSSEKQGWIMGVSEAIASIAWATTPLMTGYLEGLDLLVPMIISTLLFALSAVFLALWKPVPVESEAL